MDKPGGSPVRGPGNNLHGR